MDRVDPQRHDLRHRLPGWDNRRHKPVDLEVFDTIFVGGSSGFFVYNPSNGYLYVANNLVNNNYVVQVVGPHGVVSSYLYQVRRPR